MELKIHENVVRTVKLWEINDLHFRLLITSIYLPNKVVHLYKGNSIVWPAILCGSELGIWSVPGTFLRNIKDQVRQPEGRFVDY